MIICVDGTGPSDDAVYRTNFRHSFVKRIYNRSPFVDRIYHRGPGDEFTDGVVGTFGGRHHVSHHFVFNEIMRRFNSLNLEMDPIISPFGRRTAYEMSATEQEQVRVLQERQKIFLTGYSRGAAIVIATAMLLEARGISVEAMFLFDAVNCSTELSNTDIIPGNVRNCYHALRDIGRSGSRESFTHTGYRRASGVAGPANKYVVTTHGGIGGVLWGVSGITSALTVIGGLASARGVADIMTSSRYVDEGGLDGMSRVTPTQERAGMLEVEHWMWPFLRDHGVVTH
jgi:Uncharacterized alpha/beta hydrolase domain (DUF2235)